MICQRRFLGRNGQALDDCALPHHPQSLAGTALAECDLDLGPEAEEEATGGVTAECSPLILFLASSKASSFLKGDHSELQGCHNV